MHDRGLHEVEFAKLHFGKDVVFQKAFFQRLQRKGDRAARLPVLPIDAHKRALDKSGKRHMRVDRPHIGHRAVRKRALGKRAVN